MSNPVGLLLLAIIILYVISWFRKDPKIFARMIAILALGLVVGAGVKSIVKNINSSSPEKTVVVLNSSSYTHNSSASVVWNAELACLDYVSYNAKEGDNFITDTEGNPTVRETVSFIDDS